MTNGNLDFFNRHDKKDVLTIEKSRKVIFDTISKINLNLNNLTILTEAATGNWIYTPIIAAFSGASKVICITKNSKYGSAHNIKKNFDRISKYYNLSEKVFVCEKLTNELISSADIVTNSGFLRPIDKKFVCTMKKTGVISLMWEPWEFRTDDLDLVQCWNKGISVLGVNESNIFLNVLSYVETMIIKIFKKYKIKLKNKKIILVIENKFGIQIFNALKSQGANCYCITASMKLELKKLGATIIGSNFENKNINSFLEKSDIILVDSFPIKKNIIGINEGIEISTLKKLCPNVKIFTFFGKIDSVNLNKFGIRYYPKIQPKFGHLGWTADVLGSKPTIEFNSLGLKVGELLARSRIAKMSARQAELNALKSGFCLDFSETQRKNVLNNS